MSKLLPSEMEVLLWLDKSEKAVLARLDRHYRDAMEDIEMKISSMLGRNDANLPHVIRRIEYQRMLKEQIRTVLERLHSNEYETISQYLTDSYTDAFVGTMYTLHQQDVPLILPIDQNVVMKAVTLDSKLKESLYTTMGKDMSALKKTVAEEVTRGIATGQMYSEIARNISYAAGIPLRRAKTIARTEASRVQEQATFDAATEAKASGADVVKQWSSRRDGLTRDTHRMLDGQVREVDEPFTIGTSKAMHPHGFGVAELDINCRCTMLTRARAALDEDELKKLRERAVQHSLHVDDPKAFRKEKLPPLKNFEEFKKSYTKAAEEPENTKESEKPKQKPIVPIDDAIDFGYGDYTDEEYLKWMDDYDKHNSGVKLSKAELTTVEDYTEGGYIGLNDVGRYSEEELLKKGYSSSDIEQLRKKADMLEETLGKYDLDTDIVTHRFERDVSWLTGNGNDVAELEKLVGTEYTAKGFTSSGMLPARFRFTGGKSDAVHFEIVTPKGTNGAFLSMSKKGEDEFLYNRNTRFVVLDGGERIVEETELNFKTMQLEKVKVKERFLKVQVVTDAKDEPNVTSSVDKSGKPVVAQTVGTKSKKKSEEKRYAFTPAKTIAEAEQAISEFYNERQFGALGVSYKGIDLEVANEINGALIPLYKEYDVDMMGGIVAPAGNTKLGKQISNAFAGYSPIRKGYIINRTHMKNTKTANAAFKKEQDTLNHLFEHPEEYDFSKLSKSVVRIINASKTSGRVSVPSSVRQALQHEFGHALESKVFRSPLWSSAEKNMGTYAERISGYATSDKGEYVAESFVSYIIGEDKVDPVMVKIFESLRRK